MEKIINKYCRLAFGLMLIVAASSGMACNKKVTDQRYFDLQKSPDSVAVLYTASMQGYVDPCGCTANPLGGVSRLATLVEQAREAFAGRVILVDGGDLLFESTTPIKAVDLCQDEARIELLLSSLKSMGLVTTIFGPFDGPMGVAWRDEQLKKHQITSIDPRRLPSMVVKARGISIGIVGFSAQNASEAKLAIAMVNKEVFQLTKKGVSAIIALAQSPRALTLSVGTELRDVDVLIQGHLPGEFPVSPEKLGAQGPWLVSAGMQGQYLGVIELFGLNDRRSNKAFELDDRRSQTDHRVRLLETRIATLEKEIGKESDLVRKQFLQKRLALAQQERSHIAIKTMATPLTGPHFSVRTIPLSRDIKPNSNIHANLLAFERKLPAINAKCEIGFQCPPALKDKAHYVGAQQCRQCHQAAFAVWENAVFTEKSVDQDGKQGSRKIGHSRAWASLEKGNKTRDRSCVGCHSAGFMEPGGFCKFEEVGPFKNVQCESCHGPGSEHAKTGSKAAIRRQVPEEHCRSCHHVPHIQSTDSFNYETQLQKILGPGHGEALLKQLKHQK